MLDDLEKWVLKIYESCIGENLVIFQNIHYFHLITKYYLFGQAKITTIDMLHHIELKMEQLTQELESLNPEKVSTVKYDICTRQ